MRQTNISSQLEDREEDSRFELTNNYNQKAADARGKRKHAKFEKEGSSRRNSKTMNKLESSDTIDEPLESQFLLTQYGPKKKKNLAKKVQNIDKANYDIQHMSAHPKYYEKPTYTAQLPKKINTSKYKNFSNVSKKEFISDIQENDNQNKATNDRDATFSFNNTF